MPTIIPEDFTYNSDTGKLVNGETEISGFSTPSMFSCKTQDNVEMLADTISISEMIQCSGYTLCAVHGVGSVGDIIIELDTSSDGVYWCVGKKWKFSIIDPEAPIDTEVYKVESQPTFVILAPFCRVIIYNFASVTQTVNAFITLKI